MRSDLVFGAITQVPNRFLLTLLASKATRKLHKPGTRMQETTNSVLAHFSFRDPIPGLPVVRPPSITLMANTRSAAHAHLGNRAQNAA
jgi:hypothetical protein